ncbi:MAG: hypothetical protein H7175_22020 [Burkholderiales bacterium]|nr:hypothetical protein [Anaerolineae bacterium]
MRQRRLLIFTLLTLFISGAVQAQDVRIGPLPAATTSGGHDFALTWPVLPPTDAQIADARSCDLDTLLASRYPEALGVDELAAAHSAESACDWAVLAAAYSTRIKDKDALTAEARDAYAHAVSANPALAFTLPLWHGYFNTTPLVAPPSVEAHGPITGVNIEYAYSGMGSVVGYEVGIVNANDAPTFSATLNLDAVDMFGDSSSLEDEVKYSGAVDTALVQALVPALTDLLPVGAPFTIDPCWDNYPDWHVTLTFADNTQWTLSTNRSNFMFAGGPWQVEIDGQQYTQVSAAFVLTLLDLTRAMELPNGETLAMGCGVMTELLDLAYPPIGSA